MRVHVAAPARVTAMPTVLLAFALAPLAACTGESERPLPETMGSGSSLELDAEFVSGEGTDEYGGRQYSFESDYMQLAGVPNKSVVNGFLSAVVPGELPVDVSNNLGDPGPGADAGHLASHASEGWATANDELVSTLAPAVFTFSYGETYEYWLSATMLTDSTNQVLIDDLFNSTVYSGSETDGFEIPQPPPGVAEAATEAVLAADDPCFTPFLSSASLNEAGAGAYYDFLWGWYSYEHFVVLKEGIRFGFVPPEGASPECGTLSVLLPWAAVEADLNKLGRDLMAILSEDS
ncbi:hypothetical protein GCM10009853_032000 [Glycomyces scopariae]